MLGLPERTEFNKRIPKQKFYENMEVSPALKRVFVEQIRIIYWRNKLAATTMNIAAGEEVTEIEVFEVRVQEPQFDEAVLRQIDKEIPYHILFLLFPITFSFCSPVTEKNKRGLATRRPLLPAATPSKSAGIITPTGYRREASTSPSTV